MIEPQKCVCVCAGGGRYSCVCFANTGAEEVKKMNKNGRMDRYKGKVQN